jgi:Protein of unknown function (DUF1232)
MALWAVVARGSSDLALDLVLAVAFGDAKLAGYLALPFDLVPDFIPIAGQFDDEIIVAVVLRRAPEGRRHRAAARALARAAELAGLVLRLVGRPRGRAESRDAGSPQG